MEREKLLETFKYGYVLPEGIERMMELDTYCNENLELLCEGLQAAFRQLWKRLEEKKRLEQNIFSISLCVLRSRFLQRDGRVRIYAFNESFYLDSNALWVEWNASVLLHFLWEMENHLLSSLKDFKNVIKEGDIQEILQTEYVPWVIQYITELTRFAIRKEKIDLSPILPQTGRFCVTVGEYRGTFDEVYVEENNLENDLDLRKLLETVETKEIGVYGRNCKNLQWRGLKLKGMNGTKSNFRHMDFSGSDLSESYFIKAGFYHCNLKNTLWKDALLFDADFSDSDLSSADLSGAMAPITKPGLFSRNLLSLMGADFTNAKLEYANFSEADFSGADFRTAVLQSTVFQNTRLNGAKFSRKSLNQIELTEEQRNSIQIYD
ncbi:pentapeptide repeat-containing protein [Lacrimispora sp.]|uniref:pentapeptide repeat-containing protein n=1 Tax=Lacrimispora sp. TaxID=2719234 RepID=UPI0028AEABF1|nr:pentapeptide repeat-containing protein [Lacrimispora sp.]